MFNYNFSKGNILLYTNSDKYWIQLTEDSKANRLGVAGIVVKSENISRPVGHTSESFNQAYFQLTDLTMDDILKPDYLPK